MGALKAVPRRKRPHLKHVPPAGAEAWVKGDEDDLGEDGEEEEEEEEIEMGAGSADGAKPGRSFEIVVERTFLSIQPIRTDDEVSHKSSPARLQHPTASQ